MLNNQRLEQLESTLKETQDSYEMAKQSWDKEKAVLNQKLEFIKY
jgi:parvulin-like peptidyl-prolyl isomerase